MSVAWELMSRLPAKGKWSDRSFDRSLHLFSLNHHLPHWNALKIFDKNRFLSTWYVLSPTPLRGVGSPHLHHQTYIIILTSSLTSSLTSPWLCHHSYVTTTITSSQLHYHGYIITVTPPRLHHHGYIIILMPSHLSHHHYIITTVSQISSEMRLLNHISSQEQKCSHSTTFPTKSRNVVAQPHFCPTWSEMRLLNRISKQEQKCGRSTAFFLGNEGFSTWSL